MPPPRAIAKTLFVAGAALFAVAVAAVFFLVWELGTTHRVTTLKLGEHQLRVEINYHWDVSHDLLGKLSGPKVQHPAENIAFIGAAESVPRFTVHQATNHHVYWITADTLPNTILYALDLETGEHWPPRDAGKDGQKFVEIANRTGSSYRLYGYEWIGIKK